MGHQKWWPIFFITQNARNKFNQLKINRLHKMFVLLTKNQFSVIFIRVD